MGMRDNLFLPIQNRYAIKNRDYKVHRGSQDNRAAWQTTNMKESRSKYQHFPYHHQPLTHSLCHGHFIADLSVLTRASVAESKPERKSIVALPASPTIASMPTEYLQASFSPNHHGLSDSSGWQSVIQPRAIVLLLHHSLLSTTAEISEQASPFETLVQQEHC